MRASPRRPALVLALISVGILGGCSEARLMIHAAKKISAQGEVTDNGAYKIGNPYKINGLWYYPKVDYDYTETGIASWYGPNFHGKTTANGENFDQNLISAAHRTLPLPSLVRVTNLENGRSIRVRVNDRGPFAHGRIIDMSRRGAQLLIGVPHNLADVVQRDLTPNRARGGGQRHRRTVALGGERTGTDRRIRG